MVVAGALCGGVEAHGIIVDGGVNHSDVVSERACGNEEHVLSLVKSAHSRIFDEGLAQFGGAAEHEHNAKHFAGNGSPHEGCACGYKTEKLVNILGNMHSLK
jgi:hypothetical protein